MLSTIPHTSKLQLVQCRACSRGLARYLVPCHSPRMETLLGGTRRDACAADALGRRRVGHKHGQRHKIRQVGKSTGRLRPLRPTHDQAFLSPRHGLTELPWEIQALPPTRHVTAADVVTVPSASKSPELRYLP